MAYNPYEVDDPEVNEALALIRQENSQASSIHEKIDPEVSEALALINEQKRQPNISPDDAEARGFMEQYARTNKVLNQALAKNLISIVDIPHIAASLALMGGKALGITDREPYTEEELPSHAVHQYLREHGVDLNSLEPEEGLEKTAARGVGFMASTLAGGPVGKGIKTLRGATGALLPQAAKTVPYVSKGLEGISKIPEALLGTPGSIKEAAKMAGLAGAVGTTSGALQQATEMSELPADILSTIGVAGAPRFAQMGKNAWKGTKKAFSPAYRQAAREASYEQDVSDYLKNVVSDIGPDEAVRNIESYNSPLGYEGTTAEIAGSGNLAQLERAKRGNADSEIVRRNALDNAILRQSMEKITPNKQGIGVTKEHFSDIQDSLNTAKDSKLLRAEREVEDALGAFAHKTSPQQTGESVRGALSEKVKGLKKERKTITTPLYEKVKNVQESVYPEKALSLIDEELKNAVGSTEKSLLGIRKMLEPKNSKNIDLYNKAVSSLNIKSPELLNQLKKQYPIEGNTPTRLDKVVGEISDKIGVAKRTGEDNLARILKKVKTSLLEDLEQVPELKTAREKYSELSQPISEITKHRTLGKIIKKDEFSKNYLLGEAEVPKKVINSSMASIKDSQDLLKQVGNNKDVMANIHGYINHEVVNKITDDLGKVNLKALESWKKSNPGAHILYPQLATKLKNVQNAQYMANHIRKDNIKNVDKELKRIFEDFTGADVDKIIPNALSSKNQQVKFKKIVELAKSDKSGNSFEALKRGMIDELSKKTKLASADVMGEKNISYNKFSNYLDKNKEAFEQVFTADEIKVLNEITNALEKRNFAATAAGTIKSDTNANLNVIQAMNSGLFKKAVSKFVPGFGKEVMDYLTQIANKTRADRTNEILNRALADKDFAKLLLTKVSNKEEIKGLVSRLKENSSLIGTVVRMNYGKGDNE